MARGENAQNEKNTTLGAVRHGDGWGALLCQGGRISRIRGAGAGWEDPRFAEVRTADVELLHARLASSGTIAESNSHPFAASIRGEAWFFCHNGTLADEPSEGTEATDSERFFRRMVPRIERGENPMAAFEAAASGLKEITALNVFLLGPDGIWAFCVWADAALRTYYTLSWAETPYGVLVSSEPLLDVASRWIPMENGTALRALSRAQGDVRVVRLCLPDALSRAAA